MTVLVLSGRKRSANLGSVTQGGLEGAEEPDAGAAVLEPEEGRKKPIALN